jgi:glyoxylase-like metal-dependent hydrolase (beta-lactamase superfamily II)
MKLQTLVTGGLEENIYLLYDKKDDECVVIDPGDAKLVLDFLKKNGLKLTHILLTHGHFDHTMGVPRLKRETGAKVYIQHSDASALTDPRLNLGPNTESVEPDVRVTDGDVIDAAGFTIKVVHTPGHTTGGVCYVLDEERMIFAGDTLFRLSVGRSDLPGGDSKVLFDAIKDRLFSLEGDYTVYPGHMRHTTLQFEREHNPFMRVWSHEQW